MEVRAALRLQPVVDLILDDAGRARALLSTEVAGQSLERAPALLRVGHLDTDVHVEHILELLVHHDREERHGVRVLLLRHRRQLDQRVRMRHRHWVAVLIPSAEAAGAHELQNADHRRQRVLARALGPHEDAGAIPGHLRGRVEAVPVQEEALLLRRQAARAIAVGRLHVLVQPVDRLPPDRLVALVLRHDPAVLPWIARLPPRELLPHLAHNVHVLEGVRAGRHHLAQRHVQLEGHLSGGRHGRTRSGWSWQTSARADSRDSMRALYHFRSSISAVFS